ncbi:MAG: acetylxylan esterase [Verrucomicrobia subdivision 3 bacterium]|nr:acetylxylan esterase [Limisphaerales bacterium]
MKLKIANCKLLSVIGRLVPSVVSSLVLLLSGIALADERALSDATIHLDFSRQNEHLLLRNGLGMVTGRFGSALEFKSPLHFAELALTKRLDGVDAVTVSAWVMPRRSGEQYFVTRGLPETGANGEQVFRREETWVNLLLGTDQRGFFMGAINGNGIMPFPLVTLEEVPINSWSHLAMVKTSAGSQKFYRNGTLVHTDRNAVAVKAWPFVDTAAGEPLRLAMPLGGLMGDVVVYARDLSVSELRDAYLANTNRYFPSMPASPVLLREMDAHFSAGVWPRPLTAKSWPEERRRIVRGASKVLGEFPSDRPPLAPDTVTEVDGGTYWRRKVSFQAQPNDRVPAWLLVPKQLKGRVPAIICFYGTTSGAGKDTTAGVSGRAPGSPPHPNYAFAVDLVRAGFVVLAPDYLRDGERIKPGSAPYDTTEFYERFPNWSIHGKDIWDTSRAIDYLETLKFVDSKRIGMVGHSYGGHSTIFAAAFEPRIKAAVANGPVSDFRHHGLHWAVPQGGRHSQSLPAMRPYVLDPTLPIPITFYEFTALIAPRPLLVGQAVGEWRPMEEENYAAVKQVYDVLGHPERVRYHWYAGDHDFPPEARQAAVEWFKQWLR